MPKAIPDGWIKCPTHATSLIEETFLVFKTPLNDNSNKRLPKEDRFSMSMLLEKVDETFNKSIGLIVNLTNTKKYYDPQNEVISKGLFFEQILCEGQHAPNSSKTHEFIEACYGYISENPNTIIGVHCTHGFNRTGFLICAYLIEVCGYSADRAVEEFARIRPPGIYRQNIVNELFRRYAPRHNKIPQIAEFPFWKTN